uniref:Large ribosomal subunit protein mL48 n=1 Tax=Pseudonaja textilis TaxID=8673 RepID=A0A670ZAX6_PSETE
ASCPQQSGSSFYRPRKDKSALSLGRFELPNRKQMSGGSSRRQHCILTTTTNESRCHFSQAPPKRKNHVEMKEIDPGTEHQYGTLNIVMTGYDVCLVEHYAQYVHRLCNKLSVNVVESYAMPTKTIELVLTGEHGSKVRVDGHLTSHQRVVQIKQLTATFSPIFLEIIQNNLPEGVHLLVKEVCGFLLKYLN